MLKVNNTIYKIVPAKEFISDKTISIPKYQRMIEDDHVQSIVDYQQELYEKTGKYDFSMGTISIGHVLDINQKTIIDGQHRYLACKKLVEQYGAEFELIIAEITVKTTPEAFEIHKLINHSRPVSIYGLFDEHNTIKATVEHFSKKYKKYFSRSIHPHKPNLNSEKIGTDLKNSGIVKRLNLTDSDLLIELLENLNAFYGRHINEKCIEWGITPSVKNKFDEVTPCFYLGAWDPRQFLHTILVSQITGQDFRQMKHKIIRNERKNIPYSLRINIWNTYIGKSIREGKCYVCDEDINLEAFECGHNISVHNGGKNTIQNLRPICGMCNKSMGSVNMDDWIEMYYPKI